LTTDKVRVLTTEALSRSEERSIHRLLLLLMLMMMTEILSHLLLQDDFDTAVGSGLSNHSLFVSVPPWFDQFREALLHTIQLN